MGVAYTLWTDEAMTIPYVDDAIRVNFAVALLFKTSGYGTISGSALGGVYLSFGQDTLEWRDQRPDAMDGDAPSDGFYVFNKNGDFYNSGEGLIYEYRGCLINGLLYSNTNKPRQQSLTVQTHKGGGVFGSDGIGHIDWTIKSCQLI